VPFPDSDTPFSILSLTDGDNTNIIAVHSLQSALILLGIVAHSLLATAPSLRNF
jgi:hypothetical protein